MKRILILFISAAVIGVFCGDLAEAQNRRYKRPGGNNVATTKYRGGAVNDLRAEAKNWFVGISVNAMNYFADISPAPKKLSTDIGFTKSGFGILGGKKFNPRASMRFAFNYGKLQASDFETAVPTEGSSGLGRYQRNLSFENPIKELTLGFEFDLFPNYGGIGSRFPINPYIFVGAAIFAHNPKGKAPANDLLGNPLDKAGKYVSLRDLGTEGQNSGIDSLPGKYSKIQFAIPVGLGVKVRIHDSFDAHLEFGLRQLFFDYIDDVSGNNVELSLLDSELARAMAEGGAETTDVLSGKARDSQYFSPTTYTAQNGVTYARGPNYQPGSVRGSSKDLDFYLVT